MNVVSDETASPPARERFGGSALNCPYCKDEMERGVIQSPNEIAWVPQRSLIGAAELQQKSVVLAEKSFWKGAAVTAYLCRCCNKVIIDIEG